ncbi:AraC family transcriptional regulator [Aquimarina sp. RZ0]|uniref:helix-turn-helix domain-containing protein n=1 Tax=Aquimarina sp. RZ0 TaxID=2607730 RepID=UPI0011F3447C|nr:AraC family transcriptional regulator [Aquimarina sp. RZ0]KAA1246208.1 helix-turn-helix transcriptional regulator [Aquimarina sp. RZ0]
MDFFTSVDLILFLGISQGIFLAITLQLVSNRNRSANKVLSLTLLIAALMLAGRIISVQSPNLMLFRIASFADTVIFLFGPLVYIYVRRLTFQEFPEFRLSFYHFIPAFLHVIFFLLTLLYSLEEFGTLLMNGSFFEIYAIIEGSGVVSVFYYCFLSYILIKTYQQKEKDNLSYVQSVMSYLYVFLLVIFLFSVVWLISYMNSYYLRIPSLYFISYNLIWMCIPVYIYVVGFYSLRQPEIFRITDKKKKDTVQKERLEGEILDRLKKDLEYLMVTENIYLNNNLTLRDLSEKLSTSSNNISWLLNNIHQCSFYDYINHYRVKAFIQKIQNGEHHNHTLLALSLDSGFNSKSTFNKAFKSEMNDTPTNYIKKLTTAV